MKHVFKLANLDENTDEPVILKHIVTIEDCNGNMRLCLDGKILAYLDGDVSELRLYKSACKEAGLVLSILDV